MKNTAGLEVKYDPYACPNGVHPRHAFSQLGARSCRARLWVATSNERCGVGGGEVAEGGGARNMEPLDGCRAEPKSTALYTGHKAYSLSKNGLHQPRIRMQKAHNYY